MKKKLLLIGGGGHCKSVLDTLSNSDVYEDIGIIATEIDSSTVLDRRIIGTDEDLRDLFKQGYTDSFIAIGSVGDSSLRHKLCQAIIGLGFYIPNIIDTTACVSHYSYLGKGIFIGKKAVINADTVIEDMAIINTGAVIEHDCKIGAFVHISPGAVICGGVSVGDNTHIGANSTVIQGIKIGSGVLIGAGSVVTHSIADLQKCVGVPAKEV